MNALCNNRNLCWLHLLRGEGGEIRGGHYPGHHGRDHLHLAQVRVAALLHVALGHGDLL